MGEFWVLSPIFSPPALYTRVCYTLLLVRYLREWINPSIHQDPDYVALSSDQIQQAEGVISSVFGPKYRTEMIQTIMLQCQEFVNDCKFQV